MFAGMNTREGYNAWAAQYDADNNRTRDLEGVALRQTLAPLPFSTVLEVGCGTGKNSEWLVGRARQVLAVDLSEEMLKHARNKVAAPNIVFRQADILEGWNFTGGVFDLVVFSLVLEHIEFLGPVLTAAAGKLAPGGHLYIGELHPFKQYTGSLARFEKGGERIELGCYTHHISDFYAAAQGSGLALAGMNEWFDEDTKAVPRILSLLFLKN
jgi:SAM-dependent methyltransferase